MRRWIWVGLVALLAAPSVWAGAPGGPGGGPGGGRRGGFMGRGGPGGPMGMFMQGQQGTDPFEIARRYFTLTDEQKVGLGKVEAQADTEQRAAQAELRNQLNTKYVPLIAAVIPAAEKEKFDKVFAAISERDTAIAAAENELWTALNTLRAAQGVTDPEPNTLPFGKADIIRRYLKLTDEQHKAMDETARAGRGKMGEAMKDIQRPQDFGDPVARQKFVEATRKIREQVDGETADVMAVQLTDDQRKAYQGAAAVYDAAHKKIQEAEQACEKKLADLGAVPVRTAPPAGAGAAGAPKAQF